VGFIVTSRLLLMRPAPDEYVPYYQAYIDQVPAGDVLALLESQIGETMEMLAGLSEKDAEFRYAPGKWSIKEIIGHLADAERVFSYRALRFARADVTPLPGFEQDDYIAPGGFDRRTLVDLLAEFEAVRLATVRLFRSFDDEALMRRGLANDSEVCVRAIAFIIAGHERHHVGVIAQRYL
jgi:hypothetical protein